MKTDKIKNLSQERITKLPSYQVKRSQRGDQFFVMENTNIVSIHYSHNTALDEMERKEKIRMIVMRSKKRRENDL